MKNPINKVGNINTTIIYSQEILEEIVNKFVSIVEKLWYIHAKQIYITKYSKAWWNNDCSRNLFLYRSSKNRLD